MLSTHKIISILFEISASALFLANFSLAIVIKYIFKKEYIKTIGLFHIYKKMPIKLLEQYE